ncbi:MAG: hypothetical protein ACSHXK_16875 [Oceanococcus sp.]
MKRHPCSSGTAQESEAVWRVDSFKTLLTELEQLRASAAKNDALLMYRGHQQAKWLLDSTFVRSFKTTLFGIEPHERLSQNITRSVELHLSILNLFLLKFGVLSRPSNELLKAAREKDLDPWFEFIKRTQQYPKEQGFFLPGTNLVDWSLSSDVGLFFANDGRSDEGAIFVCDASATGKTHQKISYGTVIDLMNEKGNRGEMLGAPLLVQPPRHIRNPRPKNQQATYFAQMDMRYDLEHIWRQCERGVEDKIILKIILPKETISDISAYLYDKGIDGKFIYPDNVPGDA